MGATNCAATIFTTRAAEAATFFPNIVPTTDFTSRLTQNETFPKQNNKTEKSNEWRMPSIEGINRGDSMAVRGVNLGSTVAVITKWIFQFLAEHGSQGYHVQEPGESNNGCHNKACGES